MPHRERRPNYLDTPEFLPPVGRSSLGMQLGQPHVVALKLKDMRGISTIPGETECERFTVPSMTGSANDYK